MQKRRSRRLRRISALALLLIAIVLTVAVLARWPSGLEYQNQRWTAGWHGPHVRMTHVNQPYLRPGPATPFPQIRTYQAQTVLRTSLPDSRWRYTRDSNAFGWRIIIPLWPLPLALFLSAGLLWRGFPRRRRAGACEYCGYDLRGIPARSGGRCPECGKPSLSHHSDLPPGASPTPHQHRP
jgi:hypothetical protein